MLSAAGPPSSPVLSSPVPYIYYGMMAIGDQMFAWPAGGGATCVSYAAGGLRACCQSRLQPVRVCSEEKR